MTVDIRPVAGQIYTEARGWVIEGTVQGEHITAADVADTDVIDLQPVAETVRWVPTVPLPRHHCPDGICADLAAERAAVHEAADWRTLEAWAREVPVENKRRKTARTKRVKALRRQVAGQP